MWYRRLGRGSRALGSLLCALLLLPASLLAQTQPTVTVRPESSDAPGVLLLVDNQIVDVQCVQFQRGQQAMVWIRELEKLGWGTVESPQPDRISLKNKKVTLTFIKGQGVAMVNSLSVRLPIDTYMRGSQFMVPLSFVAKALGYQYDLTVRPVATITTTPPAATEPKARNTIRGTVAFGGAPVPGIVVRAVDTAFTAVAGVTAATDTKGEYALTGLPDGEFMAYVYTGDNPSYFNRASKPLQVNGGMVYQAETIALGRIITPVSPKIGARSVSLKGKTVPFSWKPVDGAAKYRLAVREQGSDTETYWIENREAKGSIPTQVLKPGATYEAEVTATDKKGEFVGGTVGTGGKPWTFTTTK